MKIFFRILAVLFSVAVITGCEQLTLENGKYETSLSGREDFAAIYDDLIFIRVREPSDNPSQITYWDWAGKFEIESDGHIRLKMKRELARKWDFHYDFFRRNGMITVYDLDAENSFNLRLRPANAPAVRNDYNPQIQGGFPAYK
jgi:hypothetical protein